MISRRRDAEWNGAGGMHEKYILAFYHVFGPGKESNGGEGWWVGVDGFGDEDYVN